MQTVERADDRVQLLTAERARRHRHRQLVYLPDIASVDEALHDDVDCAEAVLHEVATSSSLELAEQRVHCFSLRIKGRCVMRGRIVVADVADGHPERRERSRLRWHEYSRDSKLRSESARV